MHPGKGMAVILAGFIGTVVEWYDFAVYRYMAGILATLFSPVKARWPL
jgi:MHS family proline/betaine transporter-like MFS transporter